MPGHATETSIQMSGPGINGKITPGKGWSGRLDPEDVRSFASVYSQEQCNAVFVSLAGAYSNPAWITALDVAKVTGLSATLAAKADLVGGLVPSPRSQSTGIKRCSAVVHKWRSIDGACSQQQR